MKVLVTGGAGYIGSHTVQKLLQAGHAPVIYDNLTTGFREAVPANLPFVQGDIRDADLLEKTMKAHGIEAVIHFAAKLIVPESVEKPLEYYDNNVLGTLRTLQACAAAGVKKFIFSSTAAVYGNPEKVPVLESAAPAPMNPYGASKLMSEKIISDFSATGSFNYIVLRYFNVAGSSAKGDNGQRTKNATHLVKVASEVACGKRSQLEVFGTDYPTPDGSGVRDYIHVDDLAEAHVKALEHLQRGGASDIFNVGYGRGFSVREVIKVMRKVSQKEFAVKESLRRPGDAATIVANSDKIQKTLGWKPQYADLELICRSAYEWEQKI